MSIKDLGEKIKRRGGEAVNSLKGLAGGGEASARYYTAAVIVLVGLSSFGLGRLSAIDDAREPITVQDANGNVVEAEPSAADGSAIISQISQTASAASSVNGQMPVVRGAPVSPGGKLVASKNGTKYYFPWCAGAAKIAEANKIWFNSEAEAKGKGLQPAANCKGLK